MPDSSCQEKYEPTYGLINTMPATSSTGTTLTPACLMRPTSSSGMPLRKSA
jgi:hypothetical protein